MGIDDRHYMRRSLPTYRASSVSWNRPPHGASAIASFAIVALSLLVTAAWLFMGSGFMADSWVPSPGSAETLYEAALRADWNYRMHERGWVAQSWLSDYFVRWPREQITLEWPEIPRLIGHILLHPDLLTGLLAIATWFSLTFLAVERLGERVTLFTVSASVLVNAIAVSVGSPMHAVWGAWPVIAALAATIIVAAPRRAHVTRSITGLVLLGLLFDLPERISGLSVSPLQWMPTAMVGAICAFGCVAPSAYHRLRRTLSSRARRRAYRRSTRIGPGDSM